VAQGGTKHAYIQAAYTANGAPVHLAPGQTLAIAWRVTATGLDKVSAARLDPLERKAEYTEGYYRFFRVLAKACTWLLDITSKLVINYGVAILVLTLLIKLALFKTTFKQQASMLKMQQLQPKLKMLQETYKNDKQKLAQKQMELWKENGVNPLGGCLPIFIQIPIFTSLYMAFSHSADMRGSGFLWIKDLTLPDAVMGWTLPFSLPMIGHVLTLNPLPIIYIGVTIWMSLSQKVPPGADPQQEQQMKMMRWLPVVFGLIFYAMPSGLVLYFTANAALSTLEIKLVRRKLGLH
jgi:YidC/Oxa1 family membrane protein insertase